MLAVAAVAVADWHADTAAGKEFQNAGRYADAERMYRAAVTGASQAGPDALAIVLNNLGAVLRLQERHEEARKCYRRALQAWKQAGNREHMLLAVTLNNLGQSYTAERRYLDAEPLFYRALAIAEKTSGPRSATAATVLDNLASLRLGQDRWREAQRFYRQALAIREIILGPDHMDVASTLNNLGVLLTYRVNWPRRCRCSSGLLPFGSASPAHVTLPSPAL